MTGLPALTIVYVAPGFLIFRLLKEQGMAVLMPTAPTKGDCFQVMLSYLRNTGKPLQSRTKRLTGCAAFLTRELMP